MCFFGIIRALDFSASGRRLRAQTSRRCHANVVIVDLAINWIFACLILEGPTGKNIACHC